MRATEPGDVLSIEDWATEDSTIGQFVREKSEECLDVYRRSPARIREDYGSEVAISEGGYGHRQLFELVQNGADAILERREGDPFEFGGRIEVVLTENALYCANEGAPIDVGGVEAILHSNISNKRGAEIGHFGLGFKSVLAITRRPQFFSRSVSFGFDVERSAELIREAAAQAEHPPSSEDLRHLPGLRIAHPLSPGSEALTDIQLRELMAWATTVVKLPRDGQRAHALGDDIVNFPSRFLLFSPHVSSLILRDTAAGTSRQLQASRKDDGTITLIEDGETSEWRVFHIDHEPSDVAREDGGTIAGRHTVPIDWAVPTYTRRQVRGQFWAFFPTTYESTLTGIINAPWKTNADRQGLLEGPYNRELLNRAGELVAASLPSLLNPDDPGDLLDRLSARDTLQWADAALGEAVYQALSKVACLPDSEGNLTLPSELSLLPGDIESALPTWRSFETRPVGWAHESVGSRERRPRAIRLGAGEASTVEWLESVAFPPAPGPSKRGLQLLKSLVPGSHVPISSPLRQARVILTSSGSVAAASEPGLLLNTEFSHGNTQLLLVHPRVEEDADAMATLQALGLKGADALDELKRITPPDAVGETWERFWTVLRWVDLTSADTSDFLRRNRFKVRVRAMDGSYRRVYEVLLPGKIVRTQDAADAHAIVDVAFHAMELPAIADILGLVEAPYRGGLSRLEPCFTGYEDECREAFYRELPRGSSRPQFDAIAFDDHLDHPIGPLTPLMNGLSTPAVIRFTRILLPLASQDPPWTMAHQGASRRNAYPQPQYPALSLVAALDHGVVDSSLGPRPILDCVSGDLVRWSQFLPVYEDCPAFLDRPQRLEDVPAELVKESIARTLESTDALLVGAFYGKVAERISPPERIRCAFGDAVDTRVPSDVTVTHLQWLYRRLLEDGKRALLAEDERDARMLVDSWGLAEAAQSSDAEIRFTDPGDPSPLADLFPNLPARVIQGFGEVECTPCAEVWREYISPSGAAVVDAEGNALADNDGSLYFPDELGRAELLDAVTEQLGLKLSPEERAAALDTRSPLELRMLRQAIADEPVLERKLSLILSTAELRQYLPVHVLGAAEQRHGPLDDVSLARLVLAVHGISTLRLLRAALERNGLQPPSRWAGSARALDFVRELGFPDAFAGSHDAKPLPWVDVDGPINLNPLHVFQETIADRIVEFMYRPAPGRGLVSLPTGAGKTRVVTESLVRAFVAGQLNETVLWIADHQELCEQAVQTWREVWRALGPRSTLRISRLWGSTNRSVVPTPKRPHLVVATYQSLRSRLDGEFAWIGDAQAIVIDEAHGSVAPSYTQILAAFGLDARNTQKPLIGLTATPFRGRLEDDEETRRLVNRYSGHRFDRDVFPDEDPYPELRRLRVLADVEWRELPGSSIHLSTSEIGFLAQYKVLPSSVEGRLGREAGRNEEILAAVKACPPDWPILLFATSVDHAELLAGLLALDGIEAQAVSSRTDQDVRRTAIEAFRRKQIRVLTNYGVLTTGFDAPETRAIFVTRPVYSPGLYQQMIGRGLRGPANGGTDQCLIVNVADNVLAYGEQLAFRQFEHIWNEYARQSPLPGLDHARTP